ncbi:hypothetical protein FHG87_007629 [Trinorchestia longiramus]|nr:hypothetical protein FHG87_007629 [Trinorchestia longiramus]
MSVGVMQTKNEVLLEQSAYTKALLSRFGMDKANFVANPVDVNADLVTISDEVEDCDKNLYRSAVDQTTAMAARRWRHSVSVLPANEYPSVPFSSNTNSNLFIIIIYPDLSGHSPSQTKTEKMQPKETTVYVEVSDASRIGTIFWTALSSIALRPDFSLDARSMNTERTSPSLPVDVAEMRPMGQRFRLVLRS